MKKNETKKIVEAIVKKLGKEGVEYFKKHGELPAIKLTAEEMKVINGGGKGIFDEIIKNSTIQTRSNESGPTVFDPNISIKNSTR